MAAPLLQGVTPYRSIAVFAIGSTTPTLTAGEPSALVAAGDEQVAALVERATAAPRMAIVDLLDQQRTLGFAVVDDSTSPQFVPYAERRLSPDPNVRRRQDDAFSQLRYAIYLGEESDTALLGSSERDLPLAGRRATATIPYGDSELVLVASPTGRLGDALTANVWWVVALVGTLATAIAVAVLRRLNRRRAEAVGWPASRSRSPRRCSSGCCLVCWAFPRTPRSRLGTGRHVPTMTSDIEALDDARRLLDLSYYDLWMRYIGVGGTCDAGKIRSYLTGRHTIRDRDHDHLVVARNEAFTDAGGGRPLPYRLGSSGESTPVC